MPVEGRNRQRNLRKAPCRHPLQDVDIAHDQCRLGDDADWMPRLFQNLEYGAGDPPVALDGLIGVGIGSERYGGWPVARRGQFFLQQRGGLRLGAQLRLEVEPGGMPEIAVRWPSVTVDAAMLATAIGIDGAIEGDVGTIVAGDDGAGGLVAHHGAQGAQVLVEIPAIVEVGARLGFVATSRIRTRPPPAPAVPGHLHSAAVARAGGCTRTRTCGANLGGHHIAIPDYGLTL